MGEIVWSASTVHAPQLLTRPPQENQAQLEASIAAMAELGAGLDETRPDALILVGIDHVETFFPGSVPAFAMVTGSTATAEFAGHAYNIPIHQELATALLNGLIAADIDVTYTHEALLGHAFATPLEYVHASRLIPIIPLFVNVYLPPLPSTRRCFALGQAIAKIVADRPERVAILASGGMSHYPGTSKYFDPEYAFDQWLLQELEEGRIDSLLNLTGVDLDETGNTEMLTWLVALGATSVDHGELLTYQPTSHHGHAVMRFLPPKGIRGREHFDIPEYGGFAFKGEGYQFYKYPTAETFPLNRGLAKLRISAELRARFVRGDDSVVDELGLTPEHGAALRTYSTEAIVALGGHGILSLQTNLALQASAREAGITITSIA
jgi:2,3-dihydroxyphenylpropionate 1,2-dioxygenase